MMREPSSLAICFLRARSMLVGERSVSLLPTIWISSLAGLVPMKRVVICAPGRKVEQ